MSECMLIESLTMSSSHLLASFVDLPVEIHISIVHFIADNPPHVFSLLKVNQIRNSELSSTNPKADLQNSASGLRVSFDLEDHS